MRNLWSILVPTLVSGAIFFYCLLPLLLPASSFAQIRIKAVGDIMMGSVTPDKILPPDSGKAFAANIGSYLTDADITFGNLEGVFISKDLKPVKCSEASRKAGRCYEFGMPAYLSKNLKELSFNILSLDNNHVSDYGDRGYQYTQKLLDSLAINYAPKKKHTWLKIHEKKIAIVAFGTSSSSYHVANVGEAQKVVSALKDSFDIVLVSFHGGAEGAKAQHIKDTVEYYYGENRGNLIQFAHAVIDSGADLIIGHGPHVLRAMELYKNKLIAYSLGNFLTYGNIKVSGINGITVILDVELDTATGNFLRGKLIPVVQAGRGIPIFDKLNKGIQKIRELSTTDFPDNDLVIDQQGNLHNKAVPLVKSEEEKPLVEKDTIESIIVIKAEEDIKRSKQKRKRKKKRKEKKEK